MLLPALLVVVPIVTFTGWALHLSLRGVNGGLHAAQRDRAFYLAEAGLDRLLGTVNLSTASSGTLQGSLHGGTFSVTYTRGDEDGQDNDGDSSIDEADEADFFLVLSTGRVFKSGRTVEAILRRSVQNMEARGAVYLADIHPEISLNGNAFRISGTDTNIDGTPGTGATLPGIGTVGNPAEVIAQINPRRWANITGLGGTPSVQQVGSLQTTSFLQAVRESADIRLTNPGTYTGSLGDAQANDFKVTHVQGDIHISGGSTGAGVLFVEGDLTITGAWTYVGYVICTGRARFQGGGGGIRLYGTLMVNEDVEQMTDPERELEIGGTIDIYYSSQALSLVRSALGRFRLVLWRERGTVEP